MPQSFFIWNDVDCRAMGIRMRGPAAIIRPEERVKHVEIPGVSGDLTQLEGENIYNSYIQTVGISGKYGQRLREIFRWLRGSGWVTFSGEPGMRQRARIIGAITLNKHSHNMDVWDGEVQFYCQPLKEQLYGGDTVTITTGDVPNSGNETGTSGNQATVMNNGDVEAKPYWTVWPSDTTTVVEAGGKSLTVIGRTVGTKFYIDSETMEVIGINGGNITWKSSGDFPILQIGSNSIGGSGWSKITIDKRERWL